MAEKYRIEFSDFKGNDYRVSIGESSFSGDYTSLQATGDPLTYEYDNNSDDVFDPIRPSTAVISVYSLTNFVLQDLYSTEDMHFTVDIYLNEVIDWSGYIATQEYEEVYEPVPYKVTLKAIDGLEILKTRLFAEDITYSENKEIITYYNGRQLESQIVLDILSEIGHTTFYEFVNVYETRMDSDVDDSPMDQIRIDCDVFKDYYCWDVLSEILKKYNAFIRHYKGKFHILRPAEQAEDTVYGRYFTSATTKTGTSLYPTDQYLRRDDTHPNSPWLQVPGGVLMIQPPYQKVTIFQDYGNKDSWIENWEVKGNTLSDDTYTSYEWLNWITSGSATSINNWMRDEYDGIGLMGSATKNNYVYQSFGEYLLTTSDVLAFSIDYLYYSYYGSSLNGVELYIKVKADDADYWLYEIDEEDCGWTNSLSYITIATDIENGKTPWQTFSRAIPDGLPASGSYTITLYGPYSATTNNLVGGWKNIKLFCTNDVVVRYKRKHKGPFAKLANWILHTKPITRIYNDLKEIVEKEYVATNDIYGGVQEYAYILGDVEDTEIDNVLEQFAGSLAIDVGIPGYRVDTITLSGSSGTADITCNGITELCTYNHPLATTAEDFVNDYAAVYALYDITLTNDGIDLVFTSTVAGKEFAGATSIVTLTGNLSGTVEYTTPASSSALSHTENWNTRGSYETKPLLQIVGDEIAEMYSRPKQLIQMPIRELSGEPTLDIRGNVQDEINLYDGDVRCFSVNRGSYRARPRIWEIDLFEIVSKEYYVNYDILYGYLYNWYAAESTITNTGWHVPTKSDLDTLFAYVSSGINAKLKETGYDYWNSPNDGTNDYGFNLRGSGWRDGWTDGAFDAIKTFSYIWSDEEFLSDTTQGYCLGGFSVTIDSVEVGVNSKKQGQPIRLIKDSTTLSEGETGTYVGIDGKVYNSICIGGQEWMSENLAETQYVGGVPIPEVTSAGEWVTLSTGARCSYDNNEDYAFSAIESVTSATADSTTVTADSTTITSDSTI